MPPLITQSILAYGWRTSYIIVGIIVSVVVIIAAQFLKSDPSQKGQFPDGEQAEKQANMVLEARGFTLREAMRSGQFWLLCAIFFSFVMSLDSIIVHIVPHATDMGISTVYAAGILSVIGGASMTGRIGMGVIGDRAGNKLALVICIITTSVALFLLLGAKELWVFYLFAIIFGFGYGGITTIFSPIVANLFGLRSHGAIFGVVLFIVIIGGAISPLIAGRVFDMTGSYIPAFLGFAVFCIVSLILTSFLKIPHKTN